MSPKVILLTGAPAYAEVDLSSCTINEFDAAICQLMGLEQDAAQSPTSTHDPSPSALALPSWRVLPLTRQSIPTTDGISDRNHGMTDDFFTTADITAGLGPDSQAAQDALNQFYGQSLALHDPAAVSTSSGEDSFDTSHLATTDVSFATTTSFVGSTSASAAAPSPPPPVPPHLSDLEDIPPAHRITALIPQTVTVNLIVGVISITSPRTITTRWGRDVCLVEVLVGDETRSGFAITFWLGPEAASAVIPSVNNGVSSLRVQDVVLVQNVALHVFRGKVYGQSLRRGMTRTTLLWRRDGGGQYTTYDLGRRSRVPGSDPQRDKTQAVKNWTLQFVGGQPAVRRRDQKKSWDEPPDDTQ